MTLLVRAATRYSLSVAATEAEIRAAQRLRYTVFADELGARLSGPAPGLDGDEFDELCDHLIVRDDPTGEIVGCYRMLPPGRSPRLYSDGEFDLGGLAQLRSALVETGRSCVHPDHRGGAVVSLMWTGIARYLLLTGHRWLAGCASVPLTDGGTLAAGVWRQVRQSHLSPVCLRVRPRQPWLPPAAPPVAGSDVAGSGAVRMPPLLRGYLRLGAWVCGEPASDPDFGVADLFVLLSMDRVDPRYLRFLLGG
jgi:putative hemolysin